jgi:phosphoribosylanthranilate isomerase
LKVQIYAITSVADAVATVDAGADMVGVVVDNDRVVVEDRSIAEAREIFAAVENRAVTVALSLGTDPERIARMVVATRARILHLSGGDLSRQTITRIRERLKGAQLMVAVPVTGPEAIEIARERGALADYLILDSRAPQEAAIGATGHTHDWNISARIVAESPIPVILAGGLSPENVAEAIALVRPWAVDSLTRTDFPGQRGHKDPERVRAFVRNAQAAAARLAGTARPGGSDGG